MWIRIDPRNLKLSQKILPRFLYQEKKRNQIFSVPSNPQISSGALSSTEDTIALSIDKVFSPVGELRDTIKVTDVIQHPGGQNFSDDEWSSANESDILIRGLTPGTRYTLFIVSTLGDGNTSCDTNQDGRTDNILRSTPSVVTGCTRKCLSLTEAKVPNRKTICPDQK